MKRLTVMSFSAAIAFAGAMQARAALKYEPDSYAAQDALVLQLDGIRNVGANRPHDPTASTWSDLSGNVGGVMFVKRDAADTSAWTDNGYLFAGMSYGITAKLLPEMANLTIEAFGDFPANMQRTSDAPWQEYANYVSANVTGKDFSIFTYNGQLNLFWKTDNFGVSSRPSFGSWNCKNFSCVFSANAAKMYENGEEKVSKARTSQPTLPSTKFVLANSGDKAEYLTGDNYTRQAYGTFNAVRIYNRALTADEVAANHALDQIRFMTGIPVTNAVIATSVAGATGAEGVGAFAVNGSHDFTVPPSVKVGSTTYACTGYKLETWENGAWSSSVTVAGFAVTVSESEKVRITWQWTPVNGTLNGGYVTDGLVLWYDGVWNAGVGVHDSLSIVWKDLSVSGNDAVLSTNGVTTYGTAGWTDKAFAFYRNAWFETLAGQSFGDTLTIQTVGSFSQSTPNICNWPMLFYGSAGGSATLQMYWNNSANPGRAYLLADSFTGASGGNDSGRPYITSAWAGRYLTAVLEKTASGGRDAWIFEGAEYPTAHPGYVAGGTSSADFSSGTKWAVGSIPSTIAESERSGRMYTGTINAVRIYSRKLSPAEIAQNRAMDEARFFAGSNSVEIVADPRGFTGRETPGVYAPNGWTFTSGTATKQANGIEYAPVGYIVETWDNGTETWRVDETSDNATTYTTPVAPFAARRLTWKWAPVSGIRSASDYDVGDYVQGGLVVWLDGIRNTGADQPHDSAATTWADLSSRASTVTFAANDQSHWTDDGYRFCLGSNNEPSYALLTEKLSLGETGTIEMACDVKGSEQYSPSGDTWPRYVSFNSDGSTDYDMSVHQWKTEGRCRWKADNWSGGGNRANLNAPWDGKHAAFVMDIAKFYSYKSGVVEETQNRTAVKTMPIVYWMIGNKYNDVKAGNQLTGTMKALRVYNRPLSDAEIAHNYKVDVARFDGVLSVTNVVVAGKYTAYEGLAAGEYEVLGSGTFTAGAATDGNGKVRPVVGYTIETWENGAWSEPVSYSGSSYTYTEGTSPAKVRLMWKWHPDEMLIFIR